MDRTEGAGRSTDGGAAIQVEDIDLARIERIQALLNDLDHFGPAVLFNAFESLEQRTTVLLAAVADATTGEGLPSALLSTLSSLERHLDQLTHHAGTPPMAVLRELSDSFIDLRNEVRRNADETTRTVQQLAQFLELFTALRAEVQATYQAAARSVADVRDLADELRGEADPARPAGGRPDNAAGGQHPGRGDRRAPLSRLGRLIERLFG